MRPQDIRIVVTPKEPGATPELVDWLQAEFDEPGEPLRGKVRQVRRERQEPTLGVVNDLLVSLGTEGTREVVAYLVRFIASRLSTQPDTDLTATFERNGERLEIRASGMRAEQLREIETRIGEWMRQAPPEE